MGVATAKFDVEMLWKLPGSIRKLPGLEDASTDVEVVRIDVEVVKTDVEVIRIDVEVASIARMDVEIVTVQVLMWNWKLPELMWPLLIDMTLARLDMEMSDVFTHSSSDSAASAIVGTCSNSAAGSYISTGTAVVTLIVPVVGLCLL